MRMKKEIQRFEKKFSSGEVTPPKHNGSFDLLKSLLGEILAENLGSLEVNALSYSPYDENFYVELTGQFVTEGGVVLNYKFSRSIDPMKPLMPQIEAILETKKAVNAESARNEQAKWNRHFAKAAEEKE